MRSPAANSFLRRFTLAAKRSSDPAGEPARGGLIPPIRLTNGRPLTDKDSARSSLPRSYFRGSKRTSTSVFTLRGWPLLTAGL